MCETGRDINVSPGTFRARLLILHLLQQSIPQLACAAGGKIFCFGVFPTTHSSSSQCILATAGSFVPAPSAKQTAGRKVNNDYNFTTLSRIERLVGMYSYEYVGTTFFEVMVRGRYGAPLPHHAESSENSAAPLIAG